MAAETIRAMEGQGGGAHLRLDQARIGRPTGGRRPPADYPNRKEQTMSAKAFLAILIGASLTVSATTAQAIYEGVHGPDNQVVVGGKVIGKDPDPQCPARNLAKETQLGCRLVGRPRTQPGTRLPHR